MRRGTTPDYELSISGYDLSGQTLFVTLSQYANKVTLTGDRLNVTYDIETNTTSVIFSLTQQETLTFKSGNVEVQIRFIDADGVAQATEIKLLPVLPILFEEVIAYDGAGDCERGDTDAGGNGAYEITFGRGGK